MQLVTLGLWPFADYDYDYYGYEGYRGGYNDPYYDDYYGGYEDYEYGYGGGYGPTGPRGRGRGGPPPPPVGDFPFQCLSFRRVGESYSACLNLTNYSRMVRV